MPGKHCTVAVCKNSLVKTIKDPSTKHIRYHTFPKDPALRKHWVLLCRRSGKWKPEACHVCSDHFKPDDYERDLQAELLKLPPKKVLKKTAVPSLNLGRQNSTKKTELAEKRRGRQERRTNKKLVNELLLKKFDEDVNVALLVPKVEVEEQSSTCVDQDSLDQEQSSQEYIVEYLEETKDIVMQDIAVKPEEHCTEEFNTCDKCGASQNLKNEHGLLKHQYDMLVKENRSLGLELERSQESDRLHEAKLKEVLKKYYTLKDNRAKEHMIVQLQRKFGDGMYEIFVVKNKEVNS